MKCESCGADFRTGAGDQNLGGVFRSFGGSRHFALCDPCAKFAEDRWNDHVWSVTRKRGAKSGQWEDLGPGVYGLQITDDVRAGVYSQGTKHMARIFDEHGNDLATYGPYGSVEEAKNTVKQWVKGRFLNVPCDRS